MRICFTFSSVPPKKKNQIGELVIKTSFLLLLTKFLAERVFCSLPYEQEIIPNQTKRIRFLGTRLASFT